jgi:Tfp pilus assembly PilM family ATPase
LDGTVDRYLAVGYRSEAVKRLGDLVKAHKMNPLAVDLDMFGLVNAFEANYGETGAVPAALVFAETGRLSVVLTHKGAFVDFDTEARNLDADRPEEVAVAIREALARLQRASPGAFTGNPPRLYGAGPLLCAGAVGNALVQQVPGFQVLSPFRKIPARIGNVREEDVNKFAPQLAVAVGLAIRGGAEISS